MVSGKWKVVSGKWKVVSGGGGGRGSGSGIAFEIDCGTNTCHLTIQRWMKKRVGKRRKKKNKNTGLVELVGGPLTTRIQ